MPQKIHAAHEKDSHDLLLELVTQGNSMVDLLAAIEKHMNDQNGKVSDSCTAIARLQTINKAFYGVLAVIGGALLKLFVD